MKLFAERYTQANQLAADILMPIRLVKKWRMTIPNVKELAEKFDVSEQAMTIRIRGIYGLNL